MKISTGSEEQHPTPLPLDPQPPVAPPAPVAGQQAPNSGTVRDTTGERLRQLAAATSDVSAAMSQGMAAETDRRSGHEADILPQGTVTYGHQPVLPDVVSDWSKHTGGSDANSYDPAG